MTHMVFGNGYTVIYLNGQPAGAEVTVTDGGATCAAELCREGTASSIDSGGAPKP
jgi:hypothetical protein